MVLPGALALIRDDQPVELEAKIEPKRTQRRIVAKPESRTATDLIERQVLDSRVDIPPVDKSYDGEIPVPEFRHDTPDFGVEHQERVAAIGQSRRRVDDAALRARRIADRLVDTESIQLKRTHGRAAACEETLTDR